MRVTSEMMVTGSLQRLQGRLQRYERAQVALATGKTMQRPSDDPAQASRALTLRAALQSRSQELRAAADATSLVERSDAELQSASNVLQRVRELTISAGGVSSQTQRDAIATEIHQLQEQLLSIANTRHRGQALFAGHQDGTAIAHDGVAWEYLGDQGAIMRRVSDSDRVQVNVTAASVFGFADGDDVFTLLDDLRAAVTADDTAGVQAGLQGVDRALSRVWDGLATLGATSARVDAARQRTVDGELILRSELAEVEDVDMARAFMDLQVEEVAYEATLQALGRSLPQTLVAFLR